MQGVNLKMPIKITNDEMNLCVMILYIAHKYPEVVTNKQLVRCSEITMPGTLASKFCDVPNTKDMYTIPPKDFARIIDAAIQAELVCRLTNKRGKTKVKTFPFLPVMLIDDTIDPCIMFTTEPYCYFEEEEQNGKIVRQMNPKGELLQYMRDWLKENPQ